jgi:PadR family transcriptional regulator PadR
VLKRLQREKLLSTYDEAVSGRNRRYYAITEDGRARMCAYRDEWEAYKRRIDRILLAEQAQTEGGVNHG